MMNNTYVEVDKLAKRFFVPKQRLTAFRMLNAWMHGESLRREFWSLRDISFSVCKGEKLAIIGKNGSGKTTLLRFLAGIYEKTSGDVVVHTQPSALFRWWIGFNAELSVVDNVYLFGAIYGMSRRNLQEYRGDILRVAELEDLCFISLKGLSAGQLQRLAFSIFMHVENDFLIFDESLAFVDQSFAQKCDAYFSKLCASDKTVIISSHDIDFLRRYCQRALWLEAGHIRMWGQAQQVLSAYAVDFQQQK